ncbi:RNA polymerase sigma factor [Gloeobacter kilaueensis JS1]|uniref:RNA polymerase sigma factor n=1 Tax=Gloeobacter kilaueensis (strain ATCC BAA-2537 / CCAP 1431/1 / ULC 316 / JS1) TaxID=1183438 RepID=U5QHJ5_GLOK1|nr:RNA polymerase sigma factor [Gloeobacter kilaueensis JS1]
MQARQVFSTYPVFDASRMRWERIPRLQRNMQIWSEQEPQASYSIEQWLLFWYGRWRRGDDPLAVEHLTCYLYEPACWAARDMQNSFRRHDELGDLVQMAITGVGRVLEHYNPERGIDLKRYAARVFKNMLNRILRERHEAEVCTDWSLLRKYSLRCLHKALQRSGYTGPALECRLSAASAFKTIYVPQRKAGSSHLQPPPNEVWLAIAGHYIYHSTPDSPSATVAQLQSWLEDCAKALRRHLIIEVSLADLSSEASRDLLDYLQPAGPTPIEQLIEQESAERRRLLHAQINAVLVDALHRLDLPLQQSLQLYYSGSLNQQQIASEFDVQQYTVSRWLHRARTKLLVAVGSWVHQNLHVSLEPNIVEGMGMNTILEDWLQLHFQPSDPGELNL